MLKCITQNITLCLYRLEDAVKIALVNAKGGCGKTSSSIFLASAAQQDGYEVEVWDTDPQASATSWSILSEGQVTFPVVSSNLMTVKKEEPEDCIIFIDTPPGGGATVEAAVEVADFVIVPMLPSLSDMLQARQIARVASNTPLAVLIVSANPSANAPEVMKKALEDEGFAVFPTMIPQRESIRKSFANLPTELHGYQYIWQEIKEVMNV